VIKKTKNKKSPKKTVTKEEPSNYKDLITDEQIKEFYEGIKMDNRETWIYKHISRQTKEVLPDNLQAMIREEAKQAMQERSKS
jgi:hypothetical protein